MSKILIISHSGMNTSNDVGKTLALLFDKFDKYELAHLFFNNVFPNVEKCESMYRISDVQMVESIFKRKKAGEEYCYEMQVKDGNSNLYEKSVGRTSLKLLLRDIVWKIGRYDKEKLLNWVRKFNPEVIFLAPGYSMFIYEIAIYISKELNIPLTCFWMDDFYNEDFIKWNVFDFIRKKCLRKVIQRTIRVSSYNFVVSKEMGEYYSRQFGKSFEVLYTPYVSDVVCEDNKILDDGITFLYAGGLRLGRNEVLATLGKALEKYDVKLRIYSDAKAVELISVFDGIASIDFRGFISSAELKEEMKKSNVLLHVESFDKKNISQTRFSLSAKIPECLSMNRLLFAIGPQQQSSMKYLIDNQAALVCNSENEIENVLAEYFSTDFDETKYIENGNILLKNNHSIESIGNRLKNIFDKISGDQL